ncbi:protein kinase domain protein [Ichthyophthirius multifiliis]|uniref:Protein kinase domain protein n=1 Tax=Ichthyophthirius multifiliis TaxID=5932 RepID=G0QVQ2_ICHMU|nr:protein kinase domain protein [Ichthyophthirius multifiliis]EGR30696.1 protein kinase domain protein [Ichthyophthirius multifiliis]|eukprot:XP_004032283.1 protein kinase domain protein [Ichthyophthirius multifiliis]
MGQLCSKICDKGQSKKQTAEDINNETINLINNQQKTQIQQQTSIRNIRPNQNQPKQNININEIGTSKKSEEKQQVNYKDFQKLNDLGEGAFGNVILVKKISNGKKFAMKIIKKSKIMEQSLNRKMLIEKNVLLENKHPFLVRLKYSFQTEKKLYLVMEYCTGGELYSYVVRYKKFTLEISKFITAEIVLGLEYLHDKMKIIYRDLKPENILVSEDGHVKITDFGLGKKMDNQDQLTYTFLGTPEYIAPEIIICKQSNDQKGYTNKCDIWSFGILLFELISGQPPFTHPQRNWNIIMKQILANNPVFPKEFSPEAKDLILKCLNNEPKDRPSWVEIRAHPFYETIDWERLYSKQYESPLKQYIQKSKQKLQRPKPIMETPANDPMDLPNINGFTYDPQTLPHKISFMQ